MSASKRKGNTRPRRSDVWYNLDNAANIFPAISGDRNTNVFRISCILKQNIEATLLQRAVDEALREFRYFQVVMRRGLFWFYLEQTDRSPTVEYESERPCRRLFYKGQRTLLFTVSYYRDRINLEVFHSVSDGTGALQLLFSIIHHYILFACEVSLPSAGTPSPPIHRAEDSFVHHYDPNSDGERRSPFRQRVYTIAGTAMPGNSIKILSGEMPTKQVLALAKSKGVSATTYLTALMICSIYEGLMPVRARRKPIGVNIPVDLRNHFPSQSTRNFFGVVEVCYNFEGAPVDFDAVLRSVAEQLAEKVHPQALAERLNYNMGVQQNIFARAVPLMLKNLILRAAYNKGEHTTTCAISNLGRIVLPPEYSDYVKSFSCLLNPTPIHRLKACICSYEESFVINFTSCIAETRAQQYFFQHLAAAGVEVCITSNGGDEDEIL